MSKLIRQLTKATVSLNRLVIPERDGAIGAAYCALTDAYARILELENFVGDLVNGGTPERFESFRERAARLVGRDDDGGK